MIVSVELRQSEADRCEDVHEWLQEELGLPEWYGRNLDALWDCVTGYLPKPLQIRWFVDSEREERYSAIIELFQEAADEDEEIGFELVR